MKEEHKHLLIISFFYLIYILLFLYKFDYNPSAAIELSHNYIFTYWGEIPHGIVVQKTYGFDGQYYYMMALNPTLERILIQPHFFQRIFYPILVLVLSLGIKELIPIMMLLINYFSIIFSCYILLLILKKYKANQWLVYLFAFNVGFLITITRNLTEPLMVLFVILALYYLDKDKHMISMIFLSFALLTRELVLTLYAALLFYFFIKLDFKKLAVYSIAIIPFALWEIILILSTGTIPIAMSFNSLSEPFIGLINYFFNTSYNINYYVIRSAFNENLLSRQNLGILFQIFSPIPIILISIIQLIIIIMVFIKNKKITLYLLLLLSQSLMLLMLNRGFFLKEEIGGVGRYSVLLILIMIIFYIKEIKNYSFFIKFLFILSIVLSFFISSIFFIQRIIFFKAFYYVT
ncbi:MAG: hypothetical protein Q8N99_05490 [Nanoarchaeota archaeon]|nr:hypothetical protein [Nanoarchaeota archaeon]